MDEQIAVLAVAEKGSFEAAGKYLGIGRSAARKRVQSVESEAGTPLFRMVGKVMLPTEAGNLYLLSARESVRQAWLGLDRIQAFLRAQTNDLRIGYSTYLDTRLLDIIRRIPATGIGPPSLTRESLLTDQIVAGVLVVAPKVPDEEVVAAGHYCTFSQTIVQRVTEGSFFSTSLRIRRPPSKR